MAQIMICLVSEQRMQNIIPLYNKKLGSSFKQVLLVRSKDADIRESRFARAFRDTCEALRNSGFIVNSAEPAVDAYGIAETREIIVEILKRVKKEQTVVNFTGGTKCMSIGAYMAAQQEGVTALYVDTANEKFVWFDPDNQVREEEFDLAITVDVYLQANGKQIDQKRTRQHALPDIAYDAARKLALHWPECRQTLEVFGRAISQRQEWVSGNEVDDKVANILQNSEFIRQKQDVWEVTQKGKSFLTGKWLDAIVYVSLLDSSSFDDVQTDLRLQGIENELDVLATRKGQMAIIECKSGDLGGQNTLNKLQAIRSGFGTFARAFFVTSRKEDEVDENFRNRAREYGVREIVTQESLCDISRIVKERMRGVP